MFFAQTENALNANCGISLGWNHLLLLIKWVQAIEVAI